jgi:signal peptide peptidase SppA
MKHERYIAWCLSQPWALMPERMAAYARALSIKVGAANEMQAMDQEDENSARAATARGKNNTRSGAIAVVPVYGTIVQRASQLDLCENGTSTQQISAAIADALADDSVAQILLDIDSPGGSVYGVQELAAEIAAARKPVVAIANSLAASAAYWIGSAASEFHVTPGGQVGSIGVWMAHQDWAKALEMDGIKVTLISAGEYKTEGNPYQPLGEEAQKFMQAQVDDYYAMFTKGVAKGRKVGIDAVRNNMGKGRVYGADQALSAQMVDSVSTFDQVVARMQKNIKASAPRTMSAQAAMREIAIRG